MRKIANVFVDIILFPFCFVLRLFGRKVVLASDSFITPEATRSMQDFYTRLGRRQAGDDMSLAIWHLRDQIHLLPSGYLDLPAAEARFVSETYSSLPSALRDLVEHGNSAKGFGFRAELTPGLRERYLGRGPFYDGRPVSIEDMKMVEAGDIDKALLLCDLILRENLPEPKLVATGG